MDATNSDDIFDPTQRRLCGDGACVGVIGADDRCTVCGRTEAEAAAGDAPATFAPQADAGTGAPDSPSGGGDAVGFDPTRRLCDDGACVGVIGDDGVCRTCGRRAQ